MAFGMVSQSDFDAFRSGIEGALAKMRADINGKITDDEAAAKQSSISASQSAQSAQQSAAQISQLISDLQRVSDEIKADNSAISESQKLLKKNIESVSSEAASFKENYAEIVKTRSSAEAANQQIAGAVASLNQGLSQLKQVLTEIETGRAKISEAEKAKSDVDVMRTNVATKFKEIDDIYAEIIGRTIKNDDGSAVRVDGLRDKLQNTYADLSDKITNLGARIDEDTKGLVDKYSLSLDDVIASFSKSEKDAKANVDSVVKELNELLPGSMAAGLSNAYEEKARNEEATKSALEGSFKYAIGGLVAISIIPFAVDVQLLVFDGKPLAEVIRDTPNLILAILPLYFPVLWFAHSTNKKLNLSKRLIEEYVHKSSLGKTFAGLSKQIESMTGNDEVKKELRENLLYSFLQASAENPGRLITDYNKSDHPVMEVLENSSKLSSSLDVLAKVPGFNRLADSIVANRIRKLEEQAERVSDGLKAGESLSGDRP